MLAPNLPNTTKKNILTKGAIGIAAQKMNQLKGVKSGVTKQYNKGKLTDVERSIKN